MIGDLVNALGGSPGRVELRGLVSHLRARYRRLGAGSARDALVAEGKVLAQAVEGEATAEQLAAAVDVVRRWHWALMSSDEVLGRPECSLGCPDRLLRLVVGGAPVCALCDAPARAPEERAA